MIFEGSILTVRQPWASAIAYGGKNIENRSYPAFTTRYELACGGIGKSISVLIHAAKGPRICDPVWTNPKGDCIADTRGAIHWIIRKGFLDLFLLNADKACAAKKFAKFDPYPKGFLIATATITGHWNAADQVAKQNPWHMPGGWHWKLADMRPIVPVPWPKGEQRFNPMRRVKVEIEDLIGDKNE